MASTNNNTVDLTGTPSGNDSDCEIVDLPWDKLAEEKGWYKTAVQLLSGRKFGSPTIPAQIELLTEIMKQQGRDHFTGDREYLFDKIAAQLKSTHSNKKSTLHRSWNGTYCSQKLALIIGLADAEKKHKATSTKPKAAVTRQKKKGQAKATELDRVISRVEKMYNDMYTKYEEQEKKDANKKHRTPSLDYQKTGQRKQDSVLFDPKKACKSACPVCGHMNTMPIDDQEEVNRENEKRRREADGEPFKGISATVGCFCYAQDHCSGDDCGTCAAYLESDPTVDLSTTAHQCVCQVIFSEHHRYSIARSTAMNKAKEEKKKATCKYISYPFPYSSI